MSSGAAANVTGHTMKPPLEFTRPYLGRGDETLNVVCCETAMRLELGAKRFYTTMIAGRAGSIKLSSCA